MFSVNATDGSLTHKNTSTEDAGDVRCLAVAPGDDWVFAGKTGFGLNAYSASGSNLFLAEGSPFDDKRLTCQVAFFMLRGDITRIMRGLTHLRLKIPES